MELVDGKMPLSNGQVKLFSQLNHDSSGDAVEETAIQGRRIQPAIPDEEEIAGRAFGQVSFPIEQKAVERVRSDGFALGQDVVEEIGGLDLRWERTWQVSPGRRENHGDALFIEMGGRRDQPLGHHDDGW